MNISEPGHYNIKASQGGTFSIQFTWKDADGNPVDLTGCTGKALIYKKTKISVKPYSQLELAYTFDSTTINMVLGNAAGTILLKATAAETANWDWEDAVYDLYITFPTTEVARLLDGHVVLAARLGG